MNAGHIIVVPPIESGGAIVEMAVSQVGVVTPVAILGFVIPDPEDRIAHAFARAYVRAP